MKKLLFFKLPIAVIAFTFLIAANVSAENVTQPKNTYEKTLTDLCILKGSYKLEAKVKRSEFVTWIVRSMGYDQNNPADLPMPFKDVKKGYWAYDSLKIALSYGLIDMYPDKTFKPDNLISPKDALIIALKTLGYNDDFSKLSFKDIIDESASIGLINGVSISDNQTLTHGEAYILLYNFLTVDFKN